MWTTILSIFFTVVFQFVKKKQFDSILRYEDHIGTSHWPHYFAKLNTSRHANRKMPMNEDIEWLIGMRDEVFHWKYLHRLFFSSPDFMYILFCSFLRTFLCGWNARQFGSIFIKNWFFDKTFYLAEQKYMTIKVLTSVDHFVCFPLFFSRTWKK